MDNFLPNFQENKNMKNRWADEKTKPIWSYGTFDLDHEADPSHAQTSGDIITQRTCLYEFVKRACMHDGEHYENVLLVTGD